MNSVHHKSPFVFFSIVLLVMLAGVIYFYFQKYTPTHTILWEEASLEITTNWGTCPPTFPCYETFLLTPDGNVFYNDELKSNLSTSKIKSIVSKTYNWYREDKCTPFYEATITQNYELKIDGNFYTLGGKGGCKQMQEVINILNESINI